MVQGSHASVVILDFGSQYTQLIARRVREKGILSVILPAGAPLERVLAGNPRALILSGGPRSVSEPGAPTIPSGLLEAVELRGIPVLGICYGMQLLAHLLGGEVRSSGHREYGRMPVVPSSSAASSLLLGGRGEFQAWMSHGDEVVRLPEGFREIARSRGGALAAMECAERKFFAVQFHLEVTHTEGGGELLSRFLFDVAGIRPDWDMGAVIEEQLEKLRSQVGPEDHVICALSGGVDSTVAATLVHQAVGDRLHCVFVDHGLLRKNERAEVMAMFESKLHLPVTCVDASERFLSKLAGVDDPERKRKIIGAEFIACFDDFANDLSTKLGRRPKFLVQGTLYPDVIESSPAPGTQGAAGGGHVHSQTIKSHHNVGGLPEKMDFRLVEPLRELFKDEVRDMGRRLGVPSEFLARHPFPGPGLAVRIIGDVTRERADVLRDVDRIFIDEIRAAGLYDRIWQAFAVFLPIRSVGVQGDGRTHDHVVALRAVTSQDGMTADWYPFDGAFLARVSSRICNEVRGVNRVVYDVSSKPPATIEWE